MPAFRSGFHSYLHYCELPEPRIGADEVDYWDPGVFEAMRGAGLLREGPLARFATCDACGEGHMEEVVWLERRATGELIPYLPCPENCGGQISRDRLRQWVPAFDGLVTAIVSGLQLSGVPDEIIPSRAWLLGRRVLAGRYREVFLVRSTNLPDAANLLERCSRITDAPVPVVLVPAIAPPGDAWRNARLSIFRLTDIASLSGTEMKFDVEYVAASLPAGEPASRTGAVFSVPEGAAWPDLTVTLSEDAVLAKIGDRQRTFTIDDLMLGDGRKDAGPAKSAWQLLRVLARCGGETPPRPPDIPERERATFRKQVSTLRGLLKAAFPIAGDPLHADKRTGAYRSVFRLKLDPSYGFATPPGTTWDQCVFRELRDGRLSISVDSIGVVAARGEFEEDGNRQEAAQIETASATTFDLRSVGFAKPDGESTPEGAALLALLRGRGKLKRPADDTAVLRLNERLSRWAGIECRPLQFNEPRQQWVALFDCQSLRPDGQPQVVAKAAAARPT